MYTGLTGKISFFDKTEYTDIGYISNWSIEDTSDVLEFASFGSSGYKTKDAGLQSWSASADGAISFEADKNQKQLFDLRKERKEIKIKLFLSDDTYFEGYGFIETLSVDLSAEDKGNISISIAGNSHVYREAYKLGGNNEILDVKILENGETLPEGYTQKQNNEYGLRLYVKGTPIYIAPIK